MKCAASAGGTIQAFYCGPVRCQHAASPRLQAVRGTLLGKTGQEPAGSPPDSCAGDPPYCTLETLRYDISFCGGPFPEFHRVGVPSGGPTGPRTKRWAIRPGEPGLRRCFVDGEAKCGLTNGWSF